MLTMEALKEYGFKISLEISIWIAEEEELLGNVVSGNTVKINANKIATIKRPEPKNDKQLQQALGLFNFYRRFIDNLQPDAKRCSIRYDKCKDTYKYFVELYCLQWHSL